MTTKRKPGKPRKPRKQGLRALAATHTAETKLKALAALRAHGTVIHACEAAQISRTTWYAWIREDSAFKAAAEDVSEDVADDLETEAIKRAKDGSDTLIIFLLKSLRAEKYSERMRITIENDPRARAFVLALMGIIERHTGTNVYKAIVSEIEDLILGGLKR